MDRLDGFYRVNMGTKGTLDKWTIGRWNSQSNRIRVEQFDYKEDEVGEIDPELIDTVPTRLRDQVSVE